MGDFQMSGQGDAPDWFRRFAGSFLVGAADFRPGKLRHPYAIRWE